MKIDPRKTEKGYKCSWIGGRNDLFNSCTMSLRLKRDGKGRQYVVLAAIAGVNYEYYPMELGEFKQLIDAALAIQSAAAAES